MNYRIEAWDKFLREVKHLAKKYHSLKQDLQKLQDEFRANPGAGVDLGQGVRKISMAYW